MWHLTASKFHLVSHFLTGSKMKWSFLWINVSNINSEIREKSFHIKNERLTEILQAIRCHILWHYENMPILNILKSLPPTNENFRMKNSDIFQISAHIDCGYSLEPPRRGGSNEYPQFMFLSSNKNNNIYPSKPQFYYIKVGFKGIKII